VLALAAERAMERFLGFAAVDFAHLRTRTRYKSSQPLPWTERDRWRINSNSQFVISCH
jgi:hypothetical protein